MRAAATASTSSACSAPARASPQAGDDGADEPPAIPDELVEPIQSRGLALGIGNAVHAALEWSARRGWRTPPPDLLADLLGRQGLVGDAEAMARAERLVSGWLDSPLLAELAAVAPRAEVPFVVGLGETVVRGQIDLLVPPPDGDGVPTVVDYKTDALDGRAPADLAGRYAAQRQVYALAADAGAGARAIHVFLDAPGDPVIEEFDPARLDAARARLEATRRAHARRGVRGRREAVRRALLRLPGGRATVPEAGVETS